jgi:hypothetical protein
MSFQPKIAVISAKSTGIKVYDNTGAYNATANPTGYGAPNPTTGTITEILLAAELLATESPAVSRLTPAQRTSYINGTGVTLGSSPLNDSVYDLYAYIGYAAPSTLTANQGTGQFLLANASTVFLEAVGFTVDSVDPTKLYRIDRTKVLDVNGGYVTENLPQLAGVAITIYYEAKGKALVYDTGEACLLRDIADAELACGCSDETVYEIVQRYAQYLSMLNKFQVTLDYEGAHKLAQQLQADCDEGCLPCGQGTTTTGSSTTPTCVPPTIITQPAATAVNAGQNATLTVVAAGTGPLSYQWRKNGVNISGATSSSYTILNVQNADTGLYDVVVVNACGTVTSAAAALTITAALIPVTITLHPVDVTVGSGADGITFTVAATGSPVITYQWRKDGVNIPGATGTSLVLNDVTVADEGEYDCVVTNPVGSVTSNPGTLAIGVRVFWGWMSTIPETEGEVTTLQGSADILSGSDPIIADFRANNEPQFLIMAEPSTEPLKTKWFANINNNGNIGNPNADLFGTPLIIGAFRVYVTTYLTQNTEDVIEFRVS